MTDPITQQPFNPLSYVPAIILIGGIMGVWADLKGDVAGAALRDEAMDRRVTALEAGAAAQETRTRTLENGMSRMEERLVSIGEGIARIERRLGGDAP